MKFDPKQKDILEMCEEWGYKGRDIIHRFPGLWRGKKV